MTIATTTETIPDVSYLVTLRRQSNDKTKPEQLLVEAIHLGEDIHNGAKGLAIVPGDDTWPYRIVHTSIGTQLDLLVSRCEDLDTAEMRVAVLGETASELDFDWESLNGDGRLGAPGRERLEMMKLVVESAAVVCGLSD